MGSLVTARAAPTALLAMGARPLALAASLLALLVALPLAHAARHEAYSLFDGPPPPLTVTPDQVYKICCLGHICAEPMKDILDVCYKDYSSCDRCCSEQPPYGYPLPAYCPRNSLELAAQIALGAALVVAVAALVSIILRTCSRDTRGRAQQQRRQRQQQQQQQQQLRQSGNSSSSLDVYVTQRMHDCPPNYDDISWEKPPSYVNLQGLEVQGSSAPVGERREPSSPSYLSPTNEPAGAAPPPYPAVFSISLQVHQRESEATGDLQTATSAANKVEVPAPAAEHATEAQGESGRVAGGSSAAHTPTVVAPHDGSGANDAGGKPTNT